MRGREATNTNEREEIFMSGWFFDEIGGGCIMCVGAKAKRFYGERRNGGCLRQGGDNQQRRVWGFMLAFQS